MVKISLAEDNAKVLLNLFRHEALHARQSARPVACSVGDNSNVLSLGNGVVEDMITFINSITAANYKPRTMCADGSLFEVSIRITDTMTYSDLVTDEIEVYGVDLSTPILHTLGQSVAVTVYFRVDSGCHTEADNNAFLQSHSVYADKRRLVVIPSRHSDVSNFSWHLTSESDGNVTADVTIDTFSGVNEKVIIRELKEHLIKTIQNLDVQEC